MSNKTRFHFDETDTGVQRIAARIGEAVAEICGDMLRFFPLTFRRAHERRWEHGAAK